MADKKRAILVFCAIICIVAAGIGTGLYLSRGKHLQGSYTNITKPFLIKDSSVIMTAVLSDVSYDGGNTTLVFEPKNYLKGRFDEEIPTSFSFVGDFRKKTFNPTPQPEFSPGGTYYLFLKVNKKTQNWEINNGFTGMFLRGDDGIYRCVSISARWQAFSDLTLAFDTYMMPQIKLFISPSATPAATPNVTRRPHTTIHYISPTPSPTKKP